MLSGGMQQRASLCRSLIHNPALLMLDEPFAALDAFTREELWSVLQDLWLERKFTCTLVTHDLREAAYLADVIFVMSARPGKIVATHRVDLPRPRTIEMTTNRNSSKSCTPFAARSRKPEAMGALSESAAAEAGNP